MTAEVLKPTGETFGFPDRMSFNTFNTEVFPPGTCFHKLTEEQIRELRAIGGEDLGNYYKGVARSHNEQHDELEAAKQGPDVVGKEGRWKEHGSE